MTRLASFLRNRSGAAAAEFALVLPVALLLFFGIMDVGRYVWALNEIEKAVQAAARGEAPLDPRAGRALLQARTAPSPLDALSEREREVLALVARGMPNKLIARELAISEKTVKAHLTQVFRAIGVTDRTQAALWAERNGLSAGS